MCVDKGNFHPYNDGKDNHTADDVIVMWIIIQQDNAAGSDKSCDQNNSHKNSAQVCDRSASGSPIAL